MKQKAKFYYFKYHLKIFPNNKCGSCRSFFQFSNFALLGPSNSIKLWHPRSMTAVYWDSGHISSVCLNNSILSHKFSCISNVSQLKYVMMSSSLELQFWVNNLIELILSCNEARCLSNLARACGSLFVKRINSRVAETGWLDHTDGIIRAPRSDV